MGLGRRLITYGKCLPLIAQGYSGVRARKWVRRVRRNRRADNGYTKKEKRWAYQHGFMPGKVKRFGITDENVTEFISEKDYYYIQPVNGIYRKWLADKMTIRRFFDPYKTHLQEMYYHVQISRGKFTVIPLEDCPYPQEEREGRVFAKRDEIFRLIQEKGQVVMTGTKRNTSVILSWREDHFYYGDRRLNSKYGIIRRMRKFGNEFLIAEYVKPAADFENHYHRFGNRLRLIALNDDGIDVTISEASVRIDAHYDRDIDLLREQLRVYYSDEENAERIVPYSKSSGSSTQENADDGLGADFYDDLSREEDSEDVDQLDAEEESPEDAPPAASEISGTRSDAENHTAGWPEEEDFEWYDSDPEDFDADEDDLTEEEREEALAEQRAEREDALAEALEWEERSEDSAPAQKRRSGYFRGVYSFPDAQTGVYQGGKFVLDDAVTEARTNFVSGEEIRGQVPYWNEILDTVRSMCRFAPQLTYFAVDIVITDETFKMVNFANVPKYPSVRTYSPETVAFLKRRVAEKKALNGSLKSCLMRAGKQIRLKVRKKFAALFFPKGLLPYLSVRWITDVWKDFWTNKEASLKTKVWAYRYGFLSYRIAQYGITPENREEFISDFEYRWLRHINSKYRRWFEDKVTFKYILPQFSDCFPGYYYHIKPMDGHNRIIALMDKPEGYLGTYEDILRLARERGALALKPDEGSHGEGFCKLSFTDGAYYLNFEKKTPGEIISVLDQAKDSYLVTEYIENHPVFREIYPGAVNTIRIITFRRKNRDGGHMQIGNTYMRIGSSKTGVVDNMGAGGMYAQIDPETGWYGNAKIMTEDGIVDCPYHPDTGTLIEGCVPHWDMVKETVLRIADSVPQLEYFGFDVAVTPDGIKIPEINRFPDFPKIEPFSEATRKYLLEKLWEKKRRYHYLKTPCRTLFSLPERTLPMDLGDGAFADQGNGASAGQGAEGVSDLLNGEFAVETKEENRYNDPDEACGQQACEADAVQKEEQAWR